MGRVARVIEFARRVVNGEHVAETKVDPGGGSNLTADHFGPVGDDSKPLPDDYAATSDSAGSGRDHITGYSDPKNAGKSADGEVRRYARSSDGTIVCVVWLRNDGTLELGLAPDDFVALASRVLEELESIKTDLDGFKSTFDAHTHTYNPGPSAPAPTSPPPSGVPAPHTPTSVASSTVKVKS